MGVIVIQCFRMKLKTWRRGDQHQDTRTYTLIGKMIFLFSPHLVFPYYCPLLKPEGPCWLIWFSPQVTTSKFHLWNLKFGSCRHLWTFLKKIYEFRKVQQGSDDVGLEEGDDHDQAPLPANSNSIEALAAKLKAMQKSRHTLDLVCDIFADLRVRTLGYMRLSWSTMYICSFLLHGNVCHVMISESKPPNTALLIPESGLGSILQKDHYVSTIFQCWRPPRPVLPTLHYKPGGPTNPSLWVFLKCWGTWWMNMC